MSLLCLAIIVAAGSVSVVAPRELRDYLRSPEPDAKWSLTAAPTHDRIDLASQRWKGAVWNHTIALVKPERPAAKGVCVLEITGGPINERDIAMARNASEQTGLPVAVLFDIPNQPLWDMREDDLIAHSFEKYLETEDPTWPLLFPMAKSAIKAMDALQALTKSSSNPLGKFVATGASKRGWTSWLVGAAEDKRVVGIAPRVFDMLNFPAQLKHQIDYWGRYSPRIGDYTNRDLPGALTDPKGLKLAEMVDPYSYRSLIRVPTYIVVGANDDYWTVDAHKHYLGGLTQPHWLRIIPNQPHGMGDRAWSYAGLAAFVRSCAGLGAMPKPKLSIKVAEEIEVEATGGPSAGSMRVWTAESDSMNFVSSTWKPVGQGNSVRLPRSQRNLAVFAEFSVVQGGQEYVVCSPVEVVRRK